MKPFFSILSATILFGVAIPAAPAAVQVSLDFFHDNLESYGDWREVGDYGYCWQPRDVDRDWRPYSDGRWLYTDAGWTWDSEEPYSWAVYHYGRWARVDRVGWVWVPGTEWGPAWVSWRHSSQHVGWAPLPPEARFSHSIGFSARVDADYDIGPSNYSFVEVRNFGAPRLRAVIVAPRENLTIVRQTTNITNITYVNNVVYNEGPQYEAISRQSEQPIRRLKLERREEFDGDPRTVRAEQLRTRVDGDSLRVVAPSFDAKPASAPRKVSAKVEKPNVDRGWKDAGPPAEVAKLRTKIKSEPAAPAALPSKAKAEAPVVSSVPGQRPGDPVTKGPIEPAEKPVAAEQHKRAGKSAKAVKATPSRQLPTEPTAEKTESSRQPPSPRDKGRDESRLPAEIPPSEKAPVRMPKSEKPAPARKLPPVANEPAQKQMQEAPPKPKQAAERPVERNNPSKLERRPEGRKQAAPAGAQPEAPQPGKGKGKAKDKDEKNDANPNNG